MATTSQTERLWHLDAAKGIRLDLGCGSKKHPLCVGVDREAGDGVDIVHDLTVTPWPLPDNCAHSVFLIHVWQELPRSAILAVMDELWRVCAPGAEVFVAGYYGLGWRFVADPRAVNPCTETTFAYFDPSSDFYQAFRPTATFAFKHFLRVPMGADSDYNVVLQCIK